jgi:hypothetical protein
MRTRKTRYVPFVLFALYAGAALAVNVPVNVNFVDSKDTALNLKQIVLNPGPTQQVVENKDDDNKIGGLLLEAGKSYRVEATDTRDEKHTARFCARKGWRLTVRLAPVAVAAGFFGSQSLGDSWDWSSEAARRGFFSVRFTAGLVGFDLPRAIVNTNREPFLMANPGATYSGVYDDEDSDFGIEFGWEWPIPIGAHPGLPGVQWYVGGVFGIWTGANWSSTITTFNPHYTPDGVHFAQLEETFRDDFDADPMFSLGASLRAEGINGWSVGAGLGGRLVDIMQTSSGQAVVNGIPLEPVTATRQLDDTAWYWGLSADTPRKV